jgi:hypothetical protein
MTTSIECSIKTLGWLISFERFGRCLLTIKIETLKGGQSLKVENTFGTHLTSSNLAMMESWEDVWQEKRGWKFWESATRRSMVDTIAILEPKQKCGLADSIGWRCMKILKDMLRHAPNAKEPGTSLKEIICPWDIIYKSICSMCGE